MAIDELLVLADEFGTWDLLKSQDKEFFESSNYEAACHDIGVIQSQREITKTMMNMKRISPFLTGMAHLERVLAAIKFQHTIKVMAYVWGPVRYLLKATNLTERAFDNVFDVYEQFGNIIPPLYEYTRLFIGLPESEECLVHIYQDVLTFHRLAYKLFSLRPSVWHKLHRFTWDSLSHQPPESAIWLHGSKGFGKSVLASLLVDELNVLCTEKKKRAVPRESKTYYFYCQEEDSEHRTYLDILKGILHQMVDTNEELLPLCSEKALSSGCTTLENAEVAENLIEVFFQYNSRQYVIVDGLDECETSEEMCKTAEFFMEQATKCDNDIAQGRLRVLFMSQPMPEPVKRSMPKDDACVELRSTDNADDIRAYVKKRIPDFSERRATSSGFNLSEDDRAQLESIICHRSEDMFLYAHLAIEYLLQQPTKEKLLEKIKEEMLPKALSQMYEKLLGAIKAELLQLADGEAHWQMAKLLLGWLVCAKRPLKWHEMQSILSYDPINQIVDFDNKMLRQTAKKYLGALVHVLDGDHIRIIHSTARRYILRNEHINKQAVQCELTILCLRYLCLLSSSAHYGKDEREDKVRLGWFSFQDYACSQWHSHIATLFMECRDLFSGGNYSQEYEERFSSALKSFIDTHHENLTREPHPDLEQTPSDLAKFSGLSFYENLCFLWNHIYTHQKGTYDIRNTIGIAQLDDTLRENRIILENFTPSSKATLNDTIEDYYGPNLFKCKRVLCKFFYLGYDKKEEREAHDTRHDRPYPCPVNCNLAPAGFSSNKDKERHVWTYHPELSERPSMFEALHLTSGRRSFTCTICPKTFTRNDNLKGHMRSHFGERPYACSICEKAFARLNDRQRHEKIHSRKKT
ncbi:Zinc finger protein [Pleurostoma richardsiae]|uniref:Zinc finger protein n=1 Tax=Pleurostoma richardsiae TaxID=41990 RepID=A0AA38RYS4_9PEZI|nr:Zinc finger protein [Pleurostoma richardsiae]